MQNVEVRPLVLGRLKNSLILGGVRDGPDRPVLDRHGRGRGAQLREDARPRRSRSSGLSFVALPEFVVGVIVIVVFAVQLGWFPTSSQVPGAEPGRHRSGSCLLPAIPLMFVLFGYISRMARAGTVEALQSNYIRTAVLKGLPRRYVIVPPRLRNSLLPTITVVSVQVGYLVGGLVVVETLFDYPGIGQLILKPRPGTTCPRSRRAVLMIAIIYTVSELPRRHRCTAFLNPRVRLADVSARRPERASPASSRAGAPSGRRARGCAAQRRARAPARAAAVEDVPGRRRHRDLLGRSTRSSGARSCRTTRRPSTRPARSAAPSGAHWFGTDNLGRDVFSRVHRRRGARCYGSRRSRRCSASSAGRRSGSSPATTAAGSTTSSAASSTRSWRSRSSSSPCWCWRRSGASTRNVILVIGIIFTPLIARTVRSAVLVEREREYVAAARLRGERGTADHGRRDPAEHHRADHGRGARSGSATPSSRRRRSRSSGSASRIRRPTGGSRSRNGRAYLQVAWWMVLFPAAALATLVVGVNLRRRRPAAGGGRVSAHRVQTGAVEIDGLTVSYRRRSRLLRVLDDVSFTIEPGEAYGLVGESGCGKTHGGDGADALPAAERGGRVRRASRFGGDDLLAADERDAAALARRPDGDGLPGSRHGAQPDAAGRRPDRRGVPLPPRHGHAGGARGGGWTCSRPCRSPTPAGCCAATRTSSRAASSSGSCSRWRSPPTPTCWCWTSRRRGSTRRSRPRCSTWSRSCAAQFNTSILFVSHNLGIVARMCERVGVLYAGRLIEEGAGARALPRRRVTRTRWRCCAACRGWACARTPTGSTRSRARCRRSASTCPAASSPTAARSPATAAVPEPPPLEPVERRPHRPLLLPRGGAAASRRLPPWPRSEAAPVPDEVLLKVVGPRQDLRSSRAPRCSRSAASTSR